MMKSMYIRSSVVIAFVVLIYSCGLFKLGISSFDQYAYVQTTSIKVDALNLMDSAINDYTLHVQSVASVQTNLQKLYEYEKNRPKNELTVKQLDILMDTTGNLFGGFIIRWKKEKKLSQAFIKEGKKQVGAAFDQVALLESKKNKN